MENSLGRLLGRADRRRTHRIMNRLVHHFECELNTNSIRNQVESILYQFGKQVFGIDLAASLANRSLSSTHQSRGSADATDWIIWLLQRVIVREEMN